MPREVRCSTCIPIYPHNLVHRGLFSAHGTESTSLFHSALCSFTTASAEWLKLTAVSFTRFVNKFSIVTRPSRVTKRECPYGDIMHARPQTSLRGNGILLHTRVRIVLLSSMRARIPDSRSRTTNDAFGSRSLLSSKDRIPVFYACKKWSSSPNVTKSSVTDKEKNGRNIYLNVIPRAQLKIEPFNEGRRNSKKKVHSWNPSTWLCSWTSSVCANVCRQHNLDLTFWLFLRPQKGVLDKKLHIISYEWHDNQYRNKLWFYIQGVQEIMPKRIQRSAQDVYYYKKHQTNL